MKVVKEGKVIFEGGTITDITAFEVKDGTLEDLKAYVFEHYTFNGEV